MKKKLNKNLQKKTVVDFRARSSSGAKRVENKSHIVSPSKDMKKSKLNIPHISKKLCLKKNLKGSRPESRNERKTPRITSEDLPRIQPT